jgi:type I restriction enzyme, S subunit
MNWRTRKLGEFISIKHGWAFKGEHFSETGRYILLTPGNAHETGGLKLRPGKEKFYSGEFPSEYLMKCGDMLVVMTDLIQAAPILGGAIVIDEDDRYLHNQRLGLVEVLPDAEIDKEFLYYLLNSPDYRAQVRGTATGATVRHTAPKRICDCSVFVPDTKEEQRQVAQVLSTYDNLIENNRRRIALLEESARLLYREWFVHLRFPGAGPLHPVTGLPDGWRRAPLEEALFLQRGFDLPNASRVPDGIPVYASAGMAGFHNTAKAVGPGVVTGRSGTLGVVHYVDQDYWPLNTALWVKEFRAVTPAFAYFLLTEMDLAQLNSGSTVPTLDRKVAHAQPVIIPSADAVAEFENRAGLVFKQIKALEKVNAKATEARDALLPQLMSGEIAA